MEMVWQIQTAKNKLSEVVEQALTRGPQTLTRHGKKTAVIISFNDYKKMKGRKNSLADFFRNSELGSIEIGRSKDLPRQVDL